MKQLNSLSEEQLLKLAKKHALPASAYKTKEQLLFILVSRIPEAILIKEIKNLSFSKNPTIPPTDTFSIIYDNKLIILPQSNNRFLIIWNADPQKDSEIKAWKFVDGNKISLLLPNYARSLFLDINDRKNTVFLLYKIYLDGREELFAEYHNDDLSLYQSHNNYTESELEKLTQEHLENYSNLPYPNSSSNNFSPHGGSSSTSHFRR